jgi:hypothetical protein
MPTLPAQFRIGKWVARVATAKAVGNEIENGSERVMPLRTVPLEGNGNGK